MFCFMLWCHLLLYSFRTSSYFYFLLRGCWWWPCSWAPMKWRFRVVQLLDSQSSSLLVFQSSPFVFNVTLISQIITHRYRLHVYLYIMYVHVFFMCHFYARYYFLIFLILFSTFYICVGFKADHAFEIRSSGFSRWWNFRTSTSHRSDV